MEWNGSLVSKFETRETREFLRENWRTAYSGSMNKITITYPRRIKQYKVEKEWEWMSGQNPVKQSNPIQYIASFRYKDR